jgi:hypothetical protein
MVIGTMAHDREALLACGATTVTDPDAARPAAGGEGIARSRPTPGPARAFR